MSKLSRSNSNSAKYHLAKYTDSRKYESMATSGIDRATFDTKPYHMTATPTSGVKKRPKAYLSK